MHNNAKLVFLGVHVDDPTNAPYPLSLLEDAVENAASTRQAELPQIFIRHLHGCFLGPSGVPNKMVCSYFRKRLSKSFITVAST